MGQDEWPANGRGVLICRGSPTRGTSFVVEVVVGIEDLAVVVFDQVAVELIAARLADVVDLRAGFAAVLRTVGIGDDGGFSDVVRPERVVACAGFVIEVVGFYDVCAIDREEYRAKRQAVDVEVRVTAADVEPDARRAEGDVGDVAPIDW
jgi:hypothetical protein